MPQLELTDNERQEHSPRAVVQNALEQYRAKLGRSSSERAIHRYVPRLTDRIHFRPLADALPTPVQRLGWSGTDLWVKRDDLSSTLYGGNKIRKLEWLLARPTIQGRPLIALGAAGSHHVAAGALYGRFLDLAVTAALTPQAQPNPDVVFLSELLDALQVNVIHLAGNWPALNGPLHLGRGATRIAGQLWDTKRPPFVMYPGGSTPTGILGAIDCGLEIAEAVANGECPAPRTVCCALGSGGTAVGLALGLSMGGVDARVHAVRALLTKGNNRAVLKMMETSTRALLAIAGSRVPSVLHTIVEHDSYVGEGYGIPTAESRAAQDAAERLGLSSEQTYSSKALAAALDLSGRHPSLGPVMFVDTAPSHPPLTW